MNVFVEQDSAIIEILHDALRAAGVPYIDIECDDSDKTVKVARFDSGLKYDIRFIVFAGTLVYEIEDIFTVLSDAEEHGRTLFNINILNDDSLCDLEDSGLVVLKSTGVAIRYVLNYRDKELMTNISRLFNETELHADYVYDFLK